MLGPCISIWLLFFPMSISCLHVTKSPVTCASNQTACDLHSGLISSFSEIENIAECRQLCYDVHDCEFITFYGGNGFPYRNICQLFNSCDETLPCTECVSETKGCYKICSRNIIGAIDDNMLDIIPNIGTEVDCWELCGDKSGCEYYTYTLEDDPYYGTCSLLSYLQTPTQDCPTCVTGPRYCDGSSGCSFLYDGDNQTHRMFTQAGGSISLTITGSWCSLFQLRVLAVGGGGNGWNGGGGGGGGGGSGYIKYYNEVIRGSQTKIDLTVGDHIRDSTIIINPGDTVVAAAGHSDGGDGYSGGGGNYGGCNGGSAGGNGECANGGSGTGEDITSYRLQNYQLSPGAGGQFYDYNGGGGGGVLVDGAGPGVEETRGGAQWSHGQGYGGGGTYHGSSGDNYGHGGVIILEIIEGN